MVLADSHGISRAPCYLGSLQGRRAISPTGVSPSVPDLPKSFGYDTNVALLVRQYQPGGPTTPTTQRLPAVPRDRFSLFRFRSPLLTESHLLSLPEGTEMFHFPSCPPHTLCVQVWVTGHDSSRVAPFGNPRITVRLPTTRGLSQVPTSFIGS
jgi:hypothetical protein